MSRPLAERPITVGAFGPSLEATCPETVQLLCDAALTVHPRVTAVTLRGK